MELTARVTSLVKFATWDAGMQKYNFIYQVGMVLHDNNLPLTEEFDIDVDKKVFDKLELLENVGFSAKV